MHSYVFLVFFTCVTVMITITYNDYRFQAGASLAGWLSREWWRRCRRSNGI